MNCKSCNVEIADGVKFCPECGAAQGKICQSCKAENEATASFCVSCGTKLKSDRKKAAEPNKAKTAAKSKTSLLQSANPFMLISVAVVLGIAGIITVLSSNLPKEEVKQQVAQNNQQTMQMMQQISQLQDLLKENPESTHLNVQMGNSLFDMERFSEAIPFYRKALKTDTENINAQIDLAVCYFNTQIVDTAIIEMKRALEIDSAHKTGLFNIGIMYYNIGNMQDAKTYWNKLLKLHAGTQEAETAKQLMQNINS
jgi:cytochrome c-type biogenesis protein CcmH/NrfG